MNATSKRVLRTVLSLALAAGLLTLFLYNVDFAEVAEALADADPWLIAAAVGLNFVAYWLRAVRWQLILRSAGPTRHSTAVMAVASGYAAMTLLPARAGDVVRPILLARRDPIPTSAALASMLTERLFDLLMVVVFFVFFLLRPPAMDLADASVRQSLGLLRSSGYAVGAGLVVAILLLLVLLRNQERLVGALTRPVARFRPTWKEPLSSFLNHFLDGMRVVERPIDLALTVGASVLVWLFIFGHVHVTMLAFDLQLPFRASFLLVTLAVIGMAIPTPGGVGGIHAATQFGLTRFFAVDLARATGIAIIYHAGAFLPITIVGLLCLPVFGLSLREVRQEAEEAPADAAEETP